MAFLARCLSVVTRTARLLPISSQVNSIHRWVAPTLKELKRRENKQGGKKTNPRNTFLEWNLEAELYAFGKRLNEDFDMELLLQAFTDNSYVIKEEMRQREIGLDVNLSDNRELAEEGHRFIRDYIQRYLEVVLPRLPLEGVAGVRSHLTSESVLAHVAANLGTKDIILAAEYPVDSTTLARALKAIIGALLQSSGPETTARFIRDFIITQLQGKDVNEYWHIEDPWSMLTDIMQKENMTVEPRLIGETGVNTLLACCRVGLYVEKKMIAAGFGETIDTAKEMAAREALKKVFGTQEHAPPIDFQIQDIPEASSGKRYQISSS